MREDGRKLRRRSGQMELRGGGVTGYRETDGRRNRKGVNMLIAKVVRNI